MQGITQYDEVGDLPDGPALLGTSTVLPKGGNGFWLELKAFHCNAICVWHLGNIFAYWEQLKESTPTISLATMPVIFSPFDKLLSRWALLSWRVQNELLTHVRYLILSPWQSSEMELEIPKILVLRLPQNISNLKIESTGKLKQLYYLCD